jgi:hypothetical protein
VLFLPTPLSAALHRSVSWPSTHPVAVGHLGRGGCAHAHTCSADVCRVHIYMPREADARAQRPRAAGSQKLLRFQQCWDQKLGIGLAPVRVPARACHTSQQVETPTWWPVCCARTAGVTVWPAQAASHTAARFGTGGQSGASTWVLTPDWPETAPTSL